ncbi:MAG: helix-turn-helix domain-containing protein [Pseudomonadota bacterium]
MSISDIAARIAILDYPGVQAAAVAGLADVFLVANRACARHDSNRLAVRAVAATDLPRDPFDIVIVPPNLTDARGQDATRVHGWLRDQHSAGTVIASACAGAFWLGHSGLLNGRAATTHWALEDEFRAAFPQTTLHPEHLLVDENDIVTAGGLMAWIDLGLYVVNRWLGPQIMSDTARQLLVDPAGREQRNYRTFRPVLTHGDAPILRVQHWLEQQAHDALSVTDMADAAGLSGRTFLRRFRAATGLAPSDYLQHVRIEKARGLLERTRLPVGEVAWRTGYQDVSAFSRMFRATTGLTPGNYRRRFHVGQAPHPQQT